MDDEGIGFELVAASLRSDLHDLESFLPALATKLQGALPAATTVKYRSGLFSKKRTVESIDVDLGENRFRVSGDHGRLSAIHQRCVRGIVLKNEEVPLDVWIDELSRLLTEAAGASEASRNALKQMLEQD